MSFIGSSPSVKRLRLTPQSTIPSNPSEGDFYYEDGTNNTEGLYVYQNSSWVFIATGSLKSKTVTSVSTTYTASTSDDLILVDTSSAAFTLTLPTAVGNVGKVYDIKKTDSSTNLLTIDGNGLETIEGETTLDLGGLNNSITIVSDNSNWVILKNMEVSALYTSDTGQSIPTSSATTVVFEDLGFDTHNGMNTSTGVYTIPQDGNYQINSQVALTGFTTNVGNFATAIQKNGSDICVNDDSLNQAGTQGSNNSIIYNFVKGDTVSVIAFHSNGVSRNLFSTATRVNISITKIK